MGKTHDPILAIDPGLQVLGYAVISGKQLLTAGVIDLRKVSRSRRLKKIDDALVALIRGYRPRLLVLEQVPKRPLDTQAGLPALGRRLGRLARRHKLKLAMYSARTVRQTVVGNGWADKHDAAKAVCRRFPELRVHLTHDRKWKERHCQNMFDAVALALHHQGQTKPPSRSRRSG